MTDLRCVLSINCILNKPTLLTRNEAKSTARYTLDKRKRTIVGIELRHHLRFQGLFQEIKEEAFM